MSYEKLLEEIGKDLFDVWKEAKSTCEDSWDDETWDSLPESHKGEYSLTAERIYSKVLSYFASLVGENELLTVEEIKQAVYTTYADFPTEYRICKAQAARSKAIKESKGGKQ